MQPLRQPCLNRGYVNELSDTRLPLVVPGREHAPDLEPRDNIRPTDRGNVLLPVEGGLEIREMRWGLISWFHQKPIRYANAEETRVWRYAGSWARDR